MPKPTPKCPIRPGDPCSLCTPGADGPHNCGLVYLVMDDPELRELYRAQRRRGVMMETCPPSDPAAH